MNMNVWISEREKQHLAKIADDVERQLMWGDHSYKKNALKLDLADLYKQGKVDLAEQKRIMDMINSPAGEDLTFAETLIETISTQKPIQNGSNIQREGSLLSESRS